MRYKIFLLFVFISFSSISAFSCTTFVINTINELVFGRNLDWVSENGLIVINQRNVHKKSIVLPPNKSLEWTSKYGSVTFNQFGKEFPFGGINEEGLVVEIMVADAEYPHVDERPAVNELQWVQYQLDNAKTIEEVISSKQDIRISAIAEDLHFLVCDKEGNVAVIEFKYGRMIVYKGDNLAHPVLENDSYNFSLLNLQNNTDCRFKTAKEMVEKYDENQNVIDYSFEILDSTAIWGNWQIVYDIKNMKIYYKTELYQTIQSFDLNKFDFSCNKNTLVYDLQARNRGDVTDKFMKMTHKLNKSKLKDALVTNDIKLPFFIKPKFFNYHKKCKCQ